MSANKRGGLECSWLQSDWPGWQIVAVAVDACVAAAEGRSSRIDFFVLNRLAKDMLTQVDTVQAEVHHGLP